MKGEMMPYANSPTYLCDEDCGHWTCKDCRGGHLDKRIGRSGLCDSCRRFRVLPMVTADGLQDTMQSLALFLGDGRRLALGNAG